ncbi:hypothetical protein SAY87_023264 [Trapa incisa]|uniref:CTLH domain-containing protein n=1 Tax=Trapa incisa TaxID=236973 RepID=A0AAN7K956_9MYRT|nr:hypothetical protein SAY87_023264 [Trapa incisa]
MKISGISLASLALFCNHRTWLSALSPEFRARRTGSVMATFNDDLRYMILQFLNEEGYKEAARMFERESGSYFYMEHFEGMVMNGQWEAAERYLSSFTKLDENHFSLKIYFDMRKQHFLETLDGGDRGKALDILMKDLKVFANYDEHLFKELTQLLTFNNIRENKKLSLYKDTVTERVKIMAELKRVIMANPIFNGKLRFPDMENQRLKQLINQAAQSEKKFSN